jgi:S1-C subfamily serine protease
MEIPEPQKTRKSSRTFIAIFVIICLVSGVSIGYLNCYLTTSKEIDSLQSQVSMLQNQLVNLEYASNEDNQNLNEILGENVSVSQLYVQVKDSVVVIRGMVPSNTDFFGRIYYSQVQGSGFIYDVTGQIVVITNYHVVNDAVNITITFANGNVYPATVLGSDPYAELAVLTSEAPEYEYFPLEIASSSSLHVGDPVMVVGTPYGLTGSMSTGYVSSLGRTLSEETTGGFVIANVIQTTAALNPGNSGGPVLNYEGQVIGIATAIVEDSEGLGFAIPSNTILREINDLINIGSYVNHPWLGAQGVDMTYEIADAMNANVTYGWLITQVTSGGPSEKAGLQGGTKQVNIVDQRVIIGGDIVIAINEVRITGIDSLSAYLEEYTLTGQTVNLTVIRNNETINIQIELEERPNSNTI